VKEIVQFTVVLSVNGNDPAAVALAATMTRQWLKKAGDELIGCIYDGIEDAVPEYHDGWFYALVRVEVDPQFAPVSVYFANAN
jgi:hypothetical protein